jgi:predicted dehydrogenase
MPDYVVVASPTSHHLEHCVAVVDAGFTGALLIEKPVFANTAANLPEFRSDVFVGYNLRYLAVIRHLREVTEGRHIVSAAFHNGEYLPEWRPGRDYRTTSSAKRALGGGVLRDLSHEVDFVHHLLGAPHSLVARVDRLGDLQIDTEDSVQMIGEHSTGCVSTLSLSYLERTRRREIILTTQDSTIHADLLTGIVTDGVRETVFRTDRDETFREMHREILDRQMTIACTLQEGLAVLRTIEMIEQSSTERSWVNR